MTTNRLLSVFFLILSSFNSSGQHVIDWWPADSLIIKFSDSATLSHYMIPDTSGLWQIGHSHKTFFGIDSVGPVVMITDSINNYPVSANSSFIFKFPHIGYNTIIDFWHRYQTDSGHDGGVVEFSTDTGTTWQNIKGPCNTDAFGEEPGILTEGFYTFNDTLPTGEPAFTGIKSYTQYSRFQFYMGLPEKLTESHGCYFYDDNPVFIRFRFVSDTIADTLAGWIIDSVKIENDFYGFEVPKVSRYSPLPILPNPSTNGRFIFPAIKNEDEYTIEVYNTMGQCVRKAPYKEQLDISQYSRGLYFYKVMGAEYFSGRLMYD